MPARLQKNGEKRCWAIDTLEEKKNTNRRRTAPKHRELREADNSLHVKNERSLHLHECMGSI